jgi:flavin-binding protein dodecin
VSSWRRVRRWKVGVIIIREMVGTSPQSWSDAARQAVATASKTVRNIVTVEVVKSTAVVRDGEIVEYRVEVKIGFEYEGWGRDRHRSTRGPAGR